MDIYEIGLVITIPNFIISAYLNDSDFSFQKWYQKVIVGKLYNAPTHNSIGNIYQSSLCLGAFNYFSLGHIS